MDIAGIEVTSQNRLVLFLVLAAKELLKLALAQNHYRFHQHPANLAFGFQENSLAFCQSGFLHLRFVRCLRRQT